jgi:GTP-binding protein
MQVVRITPQGERTMGRIEYLYTYHNLAKQEVEEAAAGEIVAFAGLDTIRISDTIADPSVEETLPGIHVEEPTVRMTFGVNTSPFAGREGKTGWGTSRRLRERLFNEIRSNVALRVEDGSAPDRFTVSGRGELHLGILIETMRREGYEFEVSKPEVIYRTDPETEELLEPIEEVHVEVADEIAGIVFEMIGARHGKMVDMSTENGTTYLKYLVPTRFLIGFRSQLLRVTSGMGQVHSLHHGYAASEGMSPTRQFGSLIATCPNSDGLCAGQFAQRGALFIEPGWKQEG